MAGNPVWEQTQATISKRLESGEPLKAIFSAYVPPPDSGGLFGPAVQFALRRRTVRKYRRAARAPLARRMTIAVTSRRLVIWKADRRWRLRGLQGDLPLGRIGEVSVAGTGDRSRTVTLHLKTGGSVTLKIQPEPAAWFQGFLS